MGLRHNVLTFIHPLINITVFCVVFAMGKEDTFLTEKNGIKESFLGLFWVFSCQLKLKFPGL